MAWHETCDLMILSEALEEWARLVFFCIWTEILRYPQRACDEVVLSQSILRTGHD